MISAWIIILLENAKTTQLTWFAYQVTGFYFRIEHNKLSDNFDSTQTSQIKQVLFSKANFL